jgi:hypothetical protein
MLCSLVNVTNICLQNVANRDVILGSQVIGQEDFISFAYTVEFGASVPHQKLSCKHICKSMLAKTLYFLKKKMFILYVLHQKRHLV